MGHEGPTDALDAGSHLKRWKRCPGLVEPELRFSASDAIDHNISGVLPEFPESLARSDEQVVPETGHQHAHRAPPKLPNSLIRLPQI